VGGGGDRPVTSSACAHRGAARRNGGFSRR
jgi:hypothetical protein